MRRVWQADGGRDYGMLWKGLRVLFVVALCAGFIGLMQEKDMRVTEGRIKASLFQRIELGQYFRNCGDDLQRYVELSAESVLEEEEYIIVFDEMWYRSCLRQHEEWGGITILYEDEKFASEGHDDVEEILNKNTELKETLELIREKGAIIAVEQRYLDESIRMTEFMLDIESAPSLTLDHFDHDQSASLFWSDDKGFEEYGYENFEGNWYRFVGLNEEQQARAREAYWEKVEGEYVEFEKLFHENKDDLQNFIEASHGTILEEEAYYMLFDRESYSSARSDEEWITILYEGAFSSKEDREEITALDKNVDLKEALDHFRDKGVITSIGLSYNEKEMPMVIFWVNTECTPFVTSNNGSTNCFVWGDNKECEKYGYKNVEGNWYMHIVEPPE